MDVKEQKKRVGYHAAEFVKDGMCIGIGTGSTVFFFIERLIERVKQGLKITAISSSEASTRQALAGNIEILDPKTFTQLDLTIDGADEIDPKGRMIKGGGGALLREKIIASSSKKMIVIADSTKMVEKLGTFPLPVEILPYGLATTINKIEKFGFTGKVRESLTDNGNYILDIALKTPTDNPEAIEEKLIHVPGVVETGFFFQLASMLLIPDGDRVKEVTF